MLAMGQGADTRPVSFTAQREAGYVKAALLVKQIFRSNPTLNALRQRVVMNAGGSGPLLYRKRLASDGDQPVHTPIVLLLATCCPSAVGAFVVAVIIDPIDFLIRVRLAHVCDKIREHKPTITDGNSTSPVARVSGTIGVQTSLLHAEPNVVSATLALAVCYVALMHEMDAFTGKAAGFAPARNCPACPKVVSADALIHSAVAMAKVVLWISRIIFDHGKFPNSLAYHAPSLLLFSGGVSLTQNGLGGKHGL